jgi:dihydropteroate synthase
MGVLHYGGLFDAPEDSIARGLEVVSEGADIIDVRDDLPALEDVIAALASHTRVSIHTTDPIIAASALGAGASIVNDMSASLWPIAAEAGAGWIAVHGAEGTDPADPDVVATVRDILLERATAALEGGVDEIWIDPGVGFGKTLRQSVTLLARLDELVAAGVPVAVATSRKRFVGALLAASDARAIEPSLPGLLAPTLVDVADDDLLVDADDRIEGSLATAMHALMHGAALLRAHDVRATVNAMRLLTAEVVA